MYYNDVTRTWYDPRAPIVGKYAPKPRPPAHRAAAGHTRYIGDVWADASRRELAQRAAYAVMRR